MDFSYHQPEPRPIGRHPIARLIKAALLIVGGVTTGYLASPIINDHDDFTGIAATYPSDTVTCAPPQMVASLPNPEVRNAIPVMFPCPDERRPETSPAPSIPQTEGR